MYICEPQSIGAFQKRWLHAVTARACPGVERHIVRAGAQRERRAVEKRKVCMLAIEWMWALEVPGDGMSLDAVCKCLAVVESGFVVSERGATVTR